MKKILLGLFVLLSWQQLFAQCTNEKGFNDFPFTQNGLTVTASGTGSYRNYTGTYTSCGVSLKANSILLASSTYTTTFSSPVNDLVYNIAGSDSGEAFTVTVNNGTPTLILIGGSCSSNWTINGNILTAPSSVAGTVLQIHSTVPYTSVTIAHPSGNGSVMTMCMDGVLQSVTPTNPSVSSVAVPSNVIHKANDNLDFIVNFNTNVTVNTTGGTPSLPVTIGNTVYNATYISGSGTGSLVFRYTIASGNLDMDGITVGSAIALNGAAITDASSNNATLTLANVASTTAVLVDAIPPAAPLIATPVNGSSVASNHPVISGTAEANAIVKIYLDGAMLTSIPANLSGNYSYAPTSAQNIAYGNHTIYSTATDAAGNVSSNSNTNTFTIFQPQTIAFNTIPAMVYGDADIDAVAAATSGLAVTFTSSDQTIATIINNKVHIVAAGTVTITASQAGDATYSAATPAPQILTVNQAPLIITADGKTKTYGTANPALTLTYTGFVNGDNSTNLTTQPTVSTTATTTSAVGTYPITVAGAVAANYQISYVNSLLTVSPGIQIITFTVSPKTYGDPDFTLNATASSGLPVTYSSSNPAIATVNASGLVHIVKTGNVTISALQSGDNNYTATTRINQQLTINRAPLTVTADNQTKTYGAANPALTVTYTGLVNGDTNASLTTPPAISTTVAAGSAVGIYPITVSGAAAVNYEITYQPGTLTVAQAGLILAANNQTKTYGAANPNLTFTYTGFVNNETQAVLTAQPTISTTATAASAVGTYPVTIAGATAANYNISYTDANLTVVKAVLTVTANNQTKIYGLANPALTVAYSGFVNGDTEANLDTPPTVTTTATTTSAAGNYPVTANGAAAANYTFAYVPGTLTITNATVNSVSLAQIALPENQPAGTSAGTLAAASLDRAAVYTYSLVAGTGAADNALFAIAGNKVVTARSLDYEQKSAYSILVRATNQYGLYLDQAFSININDVNEAPTLAAIANQAVCYTSSTQNISLSGITGGPESTQNNTLSVSSTNPGLFNNLSVTTVSNGTATLNYQLAASGTAVVTVTSQDNGGTANGGTDSFSQTFTITANDLPAVNIAAVQGTQILKGQTVTLTASGGTVYSWDNAFGISGSTSSASIQVRPNQTTTYQVKASNASGCSAVASITITVADDYTLIQPANILTPNGDGKNDTWVVKNIDLYPNNTVSIFDRGGRKVKEIKSYNNDWDGSLNGAALAEGTYYYVIDFGAGKGPIKGFITILRNR